MLKGDPSGGDTLAAVVDALLDSVFGSHTETSAQGRSLILGFWGYASHFFRSIFSPTHKTSMPLLLHFGHLVMLFVFQQFPNLTQPVGVTVQSKPAFVISVFFAKKTTAFYFNHCFFKFHFVIHALNFDPQRIDWISNSTELDVFFFPACAIAVPKYFE